MPRPRNVQAYPSELFELARHMHDGLPSLRIGPYSRRHANYQRQEWWAFVRAHEPTIELAHKRIAAAIKSKNKREAEIWQNRINALDLQLEAIRRYELRLEIDLEHDDTYYLVFATKSERMQDMRAALDSLGPRKAPIEQWLESIGTPMDQPVHQHTIDPTPSLRDDPMLASLFTMPIEEKIRIGAATEEDFKASALAPHVLRDLVLAVENTEWRNRMLECLPPPDGVLVNVLGDAPAQLDSPAPLAHTGLALGGVSPDILDEFLDSKPESQSSTQEETENGST